MAGRPVSAQSRHAVCRPRHLWARLPDRGIVEDLLAALDSGQVAGAALDVFHTEPLPPEHAYWAHPAVRVWPHVSAQTNPATALDQVAAAIRRVAAGRLPDNLVDPALGY